MIEPRLNKYHRIARKIEDKKVQQRYKVMTAEELRNQTAIFREKLKAGEAIESMLVDIFATVIEADERILGKRPYYVQILAGLVLFFGDVAEMRTGEGKTLSATMPMYARGLLGNGNFLITTSSYLAWRDAEDVGRVYEALGLTVSVGVAKEGSIEELDKEKLYQADIIYTTNAALGFDYIFDNLSTSQEEQVLPEFNFALIDEVDSVLLDMALTSLVVSGAPKITSHLFNISDWFIKNLNEKEDYLFTKNRKKVWFTEHAIHKASTYFGAENILSEEWAELYRHLNLALRANHLMKKNQDYIVSNDEVILIDEMNGRQLEGMKLQAGMHQAIEAKEAVKITGETKSVGTVTYQNLFQKFKVLAGMTGTAKTEADEFLEMHDLKVYTIPTNLPLIRKDHKDIMYLSNREKIEDSLKKVKEAYEKQRPTLISTGSVGMSELYSLLLLEQKIPHSLLNATTAAHENEMIDMAGKPGTITVATAMAGRGVDIKLDEKAKKDGLLVIGTERMNSPRIDQQLRGRSGRQGERGESVFYVALDDKIVIQNATKKVRKERKKLRIQVTKGKRNQSVPLKEKRYDNIVDIAQKRRKVEDIASRKQVIQFDLIISGQREKIYASRNLVMSGKSEFFEQVLQNAMTKVIKQKATAFALFTNQDLENFLLQNIDYYFDRKQIPRLSNLTKKEKVKKITEFLSAVIPLKIKERKSEFFNAFQLDYYKKIIILKAIDAMWIEQLDTLEQMKAVVGTRSLAGKQPIYEFQEEALTTFDKMIEETWLTILRNFLLSELVYNKDGSIELNFP